MTSLDLALRPAAACDEPFMRRMLWLAAHWRDAEPPPPDAVAAPELRRYTDDFGRRGDCGFIAICHGSPIGAAWCRLVRPHAGYGHVADDVPELSIGVLPEYRGEGVGGKLIERLISHLAADVEAISLSVAAINPARRLYERHGFATHSENAGAVTMIGSLSPTRVPSPRGARP